MRKIVFDGPGESVQIAVSPRKGIRFDAGVPVEVEDALAEELLGRNPDGLDLEAAARYGVQVFREVTTAARALPSSGKGGREEVGG